MRLKIRVEVRKSLKRKKKICKKDKSEFVVQYKYERLGYFLLHVWIVISHVEVLQEEIGV